MYDVSFLNALKAPSAPKRPFGSVWFAAVINTWGAEGLVDADFLHLLHADH